MSLRIEAWTPPGALVFEKKIATVEAVDASGTRTLRGLGTGSLTLADDFEDLNYLTASTPGSPGVDVATMFRVWDDDEEGNSTWIQDWLLEPTTQALDENGLMQVGGNDVKAALAWAYVECHDWTSTPSNPTPAEWFTRDPDWRYGGSNSVRNFSFEDNPTAIANAGFEDGTRDPWRPGAVEGVSANADVQSIVVDTGSFALAVTPLLAEGGASTSLRVHPANFYDIAVRFQGSLGVSYQIGASGPGGVVPTGGSVKVDHTGGATPGGWEIQRTFVGTGAWQTVNLAFGSAGDQTSTQLSVREGMVVLNGTTFYIDNVTMTGFGVGTEPWLPTGTNAPEVQGPVIIFEASADHASDGIWSVKVQAARGHGIYQPMPGIKPGVTYTASVDVGFAGVATVVALEARDIRGRILGQFPAVIGTGAFTTLPLTFTAPDFIPGPNQTVHLAVIAYPESPSTMTTFYVDNASFYQGMPPATVGKILLDQRASLDLRLALDWITYDFTELVDSAGAAWDALINGHIIKHGGTDQLQVVQGFERMGYEARLIPDDLATGTYLLQVFNPGTLGTIHTDPGVAILMGQGVTAGNVTKRHAAFNAVQALGAGGHTFRVNSVPNEDAIGRRERLFFKEELDPVLHAGEMLAEGLNQGTTSGMTVVTGPDWPRPVTDYIEGDTIDWNLADGSGWITQRVGAISYQETRDAPLSFTLFPDTETFSGQGAVNEGVRQLLAERDLPHQHEAEFTAQDVVAGGGGGVPRAVIGAVNASPMSLRKSDFFGTGADDGLEVEKAIEDLPGEIRFTEGDVNFEDRVMSYPNGVYLTGAGPFASRLVVDNTGTIDWTFEGDGGMRFISIDENNLCA